MAAKGSYQTLSGFEKARLFRAVKRYSYSRLGCLIRSLIRSLVRFYQGSTGLLLVEASKIGVEIWAVGTCKWKQSGPPPRCPE